MGRIYSAKTGPRATTMDRGQMRQMIRVAAMTARTLGLDDPHLTDARPTRRSECAGGERPCPWVSCKYHLYLDVNPETGSIKINFPDLEPGDLADTCALDVAERGGITLDEVGVIMNLTRERIRQVEVRGLLRLRMSSPNEDELGAALLRRPGQ